MIKDSGHSKQTNKQTKNPTKLQQEKNPQYSLLPLNPIPELKCTYVKYSKLNFSYQENINRLLVIIWV